MVRPPAGNTHCWAAEILDYESLQARNHVTLLLSPFDLQNILTSIAVGNVLERLCFPINADVALANYQQWFD